MALMLDSAGARYGHRHGHTLAAIWRDMCAILLHGRVFCSIRPVARTNKLCL
jgi:hypothetical protein